MRRLVAFGCSYTFGHGLRDCFIPPRSPGLAPSQYAWPMIVSQKLNLECDNQSRPGSSNFEISLKILSYKFKPDDIVVILWTHHARDLIINDDGSYETIFTSFKSKKLKSWALINPDRTITTKYWYYVKSSNSYLETMNIKYFNCAFHKKHIQDLYKPNWANSKFLAPYMYDFEMKYPNALDNTHPGELAHLHFGNSVVDEIKDLI